MTEQDPDLAYCNETHPEVSKTIITELASSFFVLFVLVESRRS